ncbi:MAG: type II toxin-antitoxin system VapC family toxin [Gemmatimonadetes bacterium]|nr:type II toxin-antitoxin system VapC family toxin [Gemmatimonadota bacterium]
MSVAYVDTSCLVAIAFDEAGARSLARKLEAYEQRFTANLLEAEFLSALRREGVEGGQELLDTMTWVLPDRRLTPEVERALAARHVRGADLWHLACALYLAESPGDLDFLTLDGAQRDAAAALGFRTPL